MNIWHVSEILRAFLFLFIQKPLNLNQILVTMGASATGESEWTDDDEDDKVDDDKVDDSPSRSEFVRSDDDDEKDHDVDELLAEQKQLLEELYELRHKHGVTKVGQHQRADAIFRSTSSSSFFSTR